MEQPTVERPNLGSSTLSSCLQAIKIQETRIVLTAVEDTLRVQKTDPTPTAYFAVILSLLSQAISTSTGIVNKDLATSVVYLLDIVTPFVPQALLRSKFTQILTHLAPALTHPQADAPLLRPALGCLESLLCAQDAAAWALPQIQIGPRRAVAGLLSLAVDHRPKVRRRALDALTKVLKDPPPTPSLDHPAADMCAETSLRTLVEIASAADKSRRHRRQGENSNEPGLMHALQLTKTVAAASGGWPSKKIEPLCEHLLAIAKSRREYLTVAAFEVFEAIVGGMTDEMSSAKLPHLMEVIMELRPSQNDTHLLPPWVAIIARGYDVSSQVDPHETFQTLPEVFQLLSDFLSSSSYNVRVSASEGLVSLIVTCIPESILLDSSIYDDKVFEKLARLATELLSVKYQASWMEVFKVLGVMFEAFRWKSDPLLSDLVKIVGELRGDEAFTGKKEADEVLGRAVSAMGPETVLQILPLNLAQPRAGQPGRAWMLPILRQYVSNTKLAHFRSEFVPLSATLYQRVLEQRSGAPTMETKIYETVVQQIWALLPGYCNLPVDLVEAFDQSFAEQIANILYKQVELRADICKGLQLLVESNKAVLEQSSDEEQSHHPGLVTKQDAQNYLTHLATFAGNMLAVLFNVYSETLPQNRSFILRCINAYLSITSEEELMNTFTKVLSLFETSLDEAGPQTQAEKQKQSKAATKMPPMSHTFMDVVITMAIYLPRASFSTLFQTFSVIILKDDDPQLQKKAYKLIPRLAESDIGRTALQERNTELQELLLESAAKVSASAKRDRLTAIARVVEYLPSPDLHFIPSILSEVVISAKEVNEKARTAAFDLLVAMGEKMKQGGTVVNRKVPHMPNDAPDVQASLEEYFTMLSAGLAGSTPHMISASITALTRTLYHFRESLPEALLTDLVSTLDLFLTSNNREIVRSVLGFVKVCVISLPIPLMLPRLESLIPNLIGWSHEHKARFKEKVKHIMERIIRRFGIEIVEKWCPQDDRKLVTNIRKTRERRRRKKDAGGNVEGDGDDGVETNGKGRGGKFESEFDEAIYGSDDTEDSSDDDVMGRSRRQQTKGTAAGKGGSGQTFIIEDEDEPLDLLDPKSLARISSTKPSRRQRGSDSTTDRRMKAKTNLDGKLVLGDDDDGGENDPMILDTDANGGQNNNNPIDDGSGAGINAYVEAIKGKDAARRGQRGRLKFSNKKNNNKRGAAADDDGDEMDVDDRARHGAKNANAGPPPPPKKKAKYVTPLQRKQAKQREEAIARKKEEAKQRRASGGGGGGDGGAAGAGGKKRFTNNARGGGGGIKAMKNQRRGLGMGKTKGGRIAKGVNTNTGSVGNPNDTRVLVRRGGRSS
ncbi:MAG: hypothetical protein M1816_002345 [Peltula sp. TS41687]|nr:MAG: hypothetical protein M1816_002345 [Peltula sp. TS41687]